MRRLGLVLALGASALTLFVAEDDAVAGSCDTPSVSPCINSDTLWPHAGSTHFVAIGATETVAQGEVAFGLVATYLSRPITLHVAAPGPPGSDRHAIDNQINNNFLFAYGVTNRLELDAAFPVTLIQSGAGLSPITGGASAKDTAMRDLRFGVAYALVPRLRLDPRETLRADGAGREYALTARLEMSAPTGERFQFAGDRGAVFVPSVAGDYRTGRWLFGAELGLRVRAVDELVGARVGTQVVTALGAGYDLLARRELLTALLEARALPNLAEQADPRVLLGGITSTGNGKVIVPAEWMLSVRSAPALAGDLTVQVGGGGPIPFASDLPITTPRFRFELGVRYAPLGRDRDGDGVPDRDDRCPTVRGPRSSSAGAGCPEPPAEPEIPVL